MLEIIIALVALFCTQQIAHCQLLGGGYSSPSGYNGSTPVIIELAIFCDQQFTERFQQNRQKLMDYWAVYMQDVNMKFKTLQSLDISFRVTSLNIITNQTDQPFIETARRSGGTIDMGSALGNFGRWIYTRETNYPDFDIALLVTGADSSDPTLKYDSYGNSACEKSHSASLHKSTTILNYKYTLGFACYSLDRLLARVSMAYTTSTPACDEKQHFFLKCLDDSIARYLRSLAAACLHRRDESVKDALENATATGPPSLADQCKMVTRDEKATALGGEICQNINCKSGLGIFKFVSHIIPAEGSPCGPNEICFRGECLPQGYLMQNVQTGKCLKSTNRFSDEDYPQMSDCDARPSLLDQFTYLENTGSNFLATPFSLTYGAINDKKCLSVENMDRLKYEECDNHRSTLHWDLLKIGASDYFLLRNQFTNFCVTINVDDNVRLGSICDINDGHMHWRFVGQDAIPSHWFRTIIPMSELSSTINYDAAQENESKSDFNKTASRSYANEEDSANNLWVIVTGLFVVGLVFGSVIVYLVVVKKWRVSNIYVKYDNDGSVQ